MADGYVAPGSSVSQSTSQQTSNSFIPEYSATPILESIAKYSEQMAPQVYQWGMDQFNRQQGNIDNLMRTAQSYASPQRVASEMGMAEAGVQQAGEAARQSAIGDLQSYGIDPSSGRYAALDQANRVSTAASAAGAGNQQRMATQAAGNAMQQQAIAAGMQNVATGYGAAQGATNLLGVGMQLKYPPLGTTSQGTSTSTSASQQYPPAGSNAGWFGGNIGPGSSGGFMGSAHVAKGGYISPDLSNSHGEEVDDVSARLNVGEYVIPKDVVEWRGKAFFKKLIEQARKARGDGDRSTERQHQTSGYNLGGAI